MATTSGAQNDTAKTTEDKSISIDVLANDGKNSTLVSLGQSTSLLGAAIRILNGKVYYDAANSPALDGLSEGETRVDTFSYTVRLANGTLSTASV